MKVTNLVVKHNDLINARYNLSLNEQKLVFYAITKLDRDKEQFEVLDLDVKEFTKILGTTTERYSEIRELVRGLRKKEVIIDTPEEELITGWLCSIRYIKNTGMIRLKFATDLVPYLLQLQGNFTRYDLQYIANFKNKYSIRMYELLKQYEHMTSRVREFSLEHLKSLLGCGTRYKQYKYFNDEVIKKVVKEINKYTDLDISYKPVKEGRKVVGLTFTIDVMPDKEKELIDALYTPKEIKELKVKCGIQGLRLNSKNVMELYRIAVEKTESAEVDPCRYIQLNYKYMVDMKTARNKFVYLKNALEEDYAKAIPQLALGYIIPA